MEMPRSGEVTQLLLNWSKGEKEALDHLMPFLYQGLRQPRQQVSQERAARSHLAADRSDPRSLPSSG
jgi:hypothetical protein